MKGLIIGLLLSSILLLTGCGKQYTVDDIGYLQAQQALRQKELDLQHNRELEKMKLEASLYSSGGYANKKMIELQEEQLKAQKQSSDSTSYTKTSTTI